MSNIPEVSFVSNVPLPHPSGVVPPVADVTTEFPCPRFFLPGTQLQTASPSLPRSGRGRVKGLWPTELGESDGCVPRPGVTTAPGGGGAPGPLSGLWADPPTTPTLDQDTIVCHRGWPPLTDTCSKLSGAERGAEKLSNLTEAPQL